MNQITLGSLKRSESPNLRMDDKRPQKISVQKIHPINQKWAECKVLGKNITIRSYSAATSHNNILYVYGGYQILNGIQSDFYQISLDKNQDQYSWKLIQPKGEYPGTRSRHCLIGGKDRLYLFGGLRTDIKSSNSIYSCDYENFVWKKLETVGQTPPCLDSFGSTYISNENQQKILLFGGYNENKNDYTNAVLEFSITKNKWSILFEGSQINHKELPCKRSGCAIAVADEILYIFGGKNQDTRLQDLWSFNLKTLKFTQLQPKGHDPLSRNGHSLTYYNGNLYLFGGIHDITWELDDFMIYDIHNNQWMILEQQSPRKIQNKHKQNFNPQLKDNQTKQMINKKKQWYETSPTIYKRQSSVEPNGTFHHQSNNSPGKVIDEQRRKAFQNNKNEMLKVFEVKEKDMKNLINMETMSQAMKDTLDVIGSSNQVNKNQQGKLTDFGKISISKFLAPLSNSQKDIVGKKPCARDGHCATIMNNSLVIFGGDRHQMSFNDIYKLDLGAAIQQIKEKK